MPKSTSACHLPRRSVLSILAALWFCCLATEPAAAESVVEGFERLCREAAQPSRGAAAFGCETLLAERDLVLENIEFFITRGCDQGADDAKNENCSVTSDAVKLGYYLQCTEVIHACGCNNLSCTAPGPQKPEGFPISVVGTSCESPYAVRPPGVIERKIVDLVVALLLRKPGGAAQIIEAVADPSSELYEDALDNYFLFKEIDKIPNAGYFKIYSDGYVSPCYIKKNLNSEHYIIDTPA